MRLGSPSAVAPLLVKLIGQTRTHGRSLTLLRLLPARPNANGPEVESSRVAPGLLNGAGLERSRDFPDGRQSPVREAEGTTVGVILGLAMLGIAAALLLLGRPRKGEDMRPFMTSSLVYAFYPAMTLVFIAMGMLTVVMNL